MRAATSNFNLPFRRGDFYMPYYFYDTMEKNPLHNECKNAPRVLIKSAPRVLKNGSTERKNGY